MAPSDKHMCDKCKKNVNLRTQKHIFCEGDCLRVWHIPQCLSVSEEKIEELRKDSEKHWFCEKCKQKRVQRRSIMHTMDSPIAIPSNSISTNTKNTTGDTTLETILKELKSIKEQQSQCKLTLDSMKLIINDYKEIVENLTQENIDLRNNNESLHNRINKIEVQLDTKEQQTLNQNIIINGVTEQADENLEDVVINICKAINVDITREQICKVERTKTAAENSGMPKSLIVKFNVKNVRDTILKNKKITKISTKTLNINDTNNRPIYISEQLTSRKQYLFKMARDLKRMKIIQYAWVKDGDILIRKSDGSRVVPIKSNQQLSQLKTQHEQQ